MQFSERYGFKPAKLELQLEDMDDDLRNCLWSALVSTLLGYDSDYPTSSQERITLFAKAAYLDFFKKPVDTVPAYWAEILNRIKKWYFSFQWYEIYDFMEFVIGYSGRMYGGSPMHRQLTSLVDTYLDREKSGYRLVAGQFARITSEVELESVNRASVGSVEFLGSAEHIRTAILHYSNRKLPDYRNSIKESISAVEFTVRALSGSDKATLGDALKAVDKKHPLHPALKEGLLRLYGYSSDESGVRHALLEEGSNVDSIDALFMLVVCSAFCNYLSERASELGQTR